MGLPFNEWSQTGQRMQSGTRRGIYWTVAATGEGSDLSTTRPYAVLSIDPSAILPSPSSDSELAEVSPFFARRFATPGF